MRDDLEIVSHLDRPAGDPEVPTRRLLTLHLPAPMWLGARLLAEVAEVYPGSRAVGDGELLHVMVPAEEDTPA